MPGCSLTTQLRWTIGAPASRTVARPRSGQPTGYQYWRTRRSASAVPNSFKGADLAFALARRHHTGRRLRPAPTCARWPGTPAPTLPPATTAACSPARPAKTAFPWPTPPAASPTWPPTRTRHRHGAGLQQRRSLPRVPGPPCPGPMTTRTGRIWTRTTSRDEVRLSADRLLPGSCERSEVPTSPRPGMRRFEM